MKILRERKSKSGKTITLIETSFSGKEEYGTKGYTVKCNGKTVFKSRIEGKCISAYIDLIQK